MEERGGFRTVKSAMPQEQREQPELVSLEDISNEWIPQAIIKALDEADPDKFITAAIVDEDRIIVWSSIPHKKLRSRYRIFKLFLWIVGGRMLLEILDQLSEYQELLGDLIHLLS